MNDSRVSGIERAEFTDDVPRQDGTIDWDSVPTVELADQPWATGFDSDRFYRLPIVLARPIVQEYHFGDETLRLKKPESDLKDALWQVENLPYTTEHTDAVEVPAVEDIHGFTKDPAWDGAQTASLYIPIDDEVAKSRLSDTRDVSIGFKARLEFADDEEDFDGYQRSFRIFHVASADTGRCSREDGCGVQFGDSAVDVDLVPTGFTDEVKTQVPYSEGAFVKWAREGEKRHGRVEDSDDERTLVRPYVSGTFAEESTWLRTSRLSSWVGPNVDSCPGDSCSCGCHIDVTDEAPSGVYVTDGKWFGVGPDEHSDESTKHPDDAKYPLTSCETIQEAWNLRGNGDYDIKQNTLERRIKAAAEQKGCSAANKPWTDDASNVQSLDDYLIQQIL